MATPRPIVKYTPVAVMGLLLVAWVVDSIRQPIDPMGHVVAFCPSEPALTNMSDLDRSDVPSFPFQHPAAEQVSRIFLTLPVDSEDAYRALPKRDRYLWDVSWFECQVTNGGFDQYLWNDTGNHAANCLEALRAIGAEDSSRMLSQLLSTFPEGKPGLDQDVRRKQMRDLRHNNHMDELIETTNLEPDLYQRLLDYYRAADPSEI